VAAAIDEAVEGADLLERARELLAEGRPGEAEELAARAVEVAPASEPARALLAQAEAALGERLRAELIEVVRVPVLRVKPGDIQALRLSSSDKYLLSRCDGRRSVRQLVQIAPLKELEVLKALRRFTDDQVVRLEAGAP
jgi:hypothetical protein